MSVKQTTALNLELVPRTAGYRQPVVVMGTIDAVAGDTTVALYRRAVDATTETLVDGAIP